MRDRPGDGLAAALWIFATLEAVGSARLLERLCNEHDAYRWICGGLTINRGLRQFLVRGIPKCLAVLTLFALAHNVMRAVDLLGTRA